MSKYSLLAIPFMILITLAGLADQKTSIERVINNIMVVAR